MKRAALILLFAIGCAQSHERGDDAGVSSALDAGSAADAGRATDGGRRADSGPPTPGVQCGPNRCLTTEICCNAECGVCAFPGECEDFGCL
jgi:hypothetical protein